jgi:hypothetical protein
MGFPAGAIAPLSDDPPVRLSGTAASPNRSTRPERPDPSNFYTTPGHSYPAG